MTASQFASFVFSLLSAHLVGKQRCCGVDGHHSHRLREGRADPGKEAAQAQNLTLAHAARAFYGKRKDLAGTGTCQSLVCVMETSCGVLVKEGEDRPAIS